MEQTQRVMIVDDNIIDQMITAHIIRKTYANRDILVMESAMEALDYLDINKDNPAAIPSIIFLDIDMPVMNGFDFLDRFTKFTGNLKEVCKIVVVTGSDIPSDIEMMKAHPNVSRLLLKPINGNELVPANS